MRSGLCCKQYGAWASEPTSTRFRKHVWLSCRRNKAAVASAVSGVRSMFAAVDLSQRTRCNGPERPSNLRWRFATAVIRPVGVALKRARDNIMRRTASERRSAAWPQYNRLFRLVVLSPRRRRLRARMMSALDGRGNGDRGGKVVAVLFSLSKPELGSA